MSTLLPLAANGVAQAQITDDQFKERLVPLAARWKAHARAGLELRHETGVLLNQRLGDPSERQNRGEGVLKDLAEELQTSVSELSRMRKFAYLFSSMEEFKREHPSLTTWTKVKDELPKLGAQPGGDEQVTASDSKPKGFDPKPMIRSLEALASDLQKARKDLSENQKQDFLAKFRLLIEAVADCLNVRVTVDQNPSEETSDEEPSEGA